jgi:peroxiredoxin
MAAWNCKFKYKKVIKMALMYTPKERNTNFKAPDFDNLKGVDGKIYALKDIQKQNGFLVMFICNHCPYVQGIMDRLPETMESLQKMGIGVIAINSNDTQAYPEDSFENMITFAKANHFTFPYVLDETQQTAKVYDAICTPDFFLFNVDSTLQYRGRLDSSGKNPASAETVPELLKAAEEIALYGEFSGNQTPAMGCSIKWKPS